jgi:hypothetical protein
MKPNLRKLVPVGAVALGAGVVGIVLGGTGIGSAATSARPTNQQPPTISGQPQVGQTLTANEGEWTGNPTDFDYAWRRCDANGGSCSLISGANQKTYVLKEVDEGNTIRVRVTAQNADGRTTRTTVPTAVITAAPAPPPPATGCARQGSGPVAVNELGDSDQLLVDRFTLTPPVVGAAPDALTARFHVTACKGKPVQGALVYVTAVPYNQFSIPAEVATGADGWAELRMGRLRGYPANPGRQQLLVMFVRARDPGGNVLGGVTARRLVSFPVDLQR